MEHTRSPHEPQFQSAFSDDQSLGHYKEQHMECDESQARICPHPGCGQTFEDQAKLLTHFHGLHPLSVYLPGKKNPFKCPFCPKKYRMERHMLAHQRKDHLTDKEPSRNDISNQEALIRRSHISMARKASQAISEEIGSTTRVRIILNFLADGEPTVFLSIQSLSIPIAISTTTTMPPTDPSGDIKGFRLRPRIRRSETSSQYIEFRNHKILPRSNPRHPFFESRS